MFESIFLVSAIAAGISVPAPTMDLAAIPRVIAKEPAYQGKPKYCLLVFGKDMKSRAWLVVDDRHYYFDRTGAGDFTQPNAKIALGPNNNYGFTIQNIAKFEKAANTTLRVMFHNDGTFELMFIAGGNRTQYVGMDLMDRPTWGNKAENAPVIHFDGPMSFERYGPLVTIHRGDGRNRNLYSLRLMLGTPGVGKGTFASYDEICSEQLGKVQADIVYSHASKIGEMIEQRVELLHDG